MRYHKEGYTCASDRGNPKKPDRHTQLQLHRHLNHPFPHLPYPSMAHLVRQLSASVIESHSTIEANIRYQRPTFLQMHLVSEHWRLPSTVHTRSPIRSRVVTHYRLACLHSSASNSVIDAAYSHAQNRGQAIPAPGEVACRFRDETVTSKMKGNVGKPRVKPLKKALSERGNQPISRKR